MKKLLPAEPAASAAKVGLRYVIDSKPGITRHARGRRFIYRDKSGHQVSDHNTLIRIKRLAIPPAWTGVWICPEESGHLQATGRDARGRKQYRYHPDWRAVRDETKYDRMLAFARALPGIRRRVARDLGRRELSREKVLAAVVRLLESTLIRVGNSEYALSNRSYGLTTLRDHHVKVRGPKITFSFKGKSGKSHTIDLEDEKLARIVKRCRDLPGYELFQYVNAAGETVDISSTDVNQYLRDIAGADFTAKDFRTWAGTVLAARALREFEAFESKQQARTNMLGAIEAVAKMLGNTPAICRRCYVHPLVLDAYLEGNLVERLKQKATEKLAHEIRNLRPEEAAVLMLLRQTLRPGARRKQ